MASSETKENIFTVSLEQRNGAKKEKWWHVDKKMLRYKIHYLLLTGGMGTISPFIPVFAKATLGLSATSFGAIITSVQFITLISRPLIGFIVDYFNILKAAICIFAVGQTALFFACFTLPPISFDTTNYLNDTNCMSLSHSTRNYTLYVKFSDSQDMTNIEKQFYLLKYEHNPSIETLNLKSNLSFYVNNTKLPCLNHHYIYLESIETNYDNLHKDPENCTPYANATINYLHSLEISNESYHADVALCTELGFPICTTRSDPLRINENCTSFENFDTKSCDNKSHLKDSSLPFLLCLLSTNVSNKTDVSLGICCFNMSSDRHFNSHNVSQVDPSQTVNNVSIVLYFQAYQFWIFAAVFTAANVCGYSLILLSETACCESVQLNGADYGKQRLWGPIGWGIMSAVGGLLSDYTHGYMVACILQAALYAAMFFNICQMDLVKPNFSQKYLKDMGSIMRSRPFLSFAFGVFINGIASSMIWYYLVWFLTSIGANNTLSGLVHTLQNLVGQLPFMFFAGWIIKKIGHFHVTSLSLFMYFIRFLWYSFLQNPWLVLPIEWTHGITYGVYYTATVSFAKLNSKPGTETTSQALLSSFDTLGVLTGNAIGGVCIDYIGGHQAFFYASLFYCFCAIISFTFTQLCQKNHQTITIAQ